MVLSSQMGSVSVVRTGQERRDGVLGGEAPEGAPSVLGAEDDVQLISRLRKWKERS